MSTYTKEQIESSPIWGVVLFRRPEPGQVLINKSHRIDQGLTLTEANERVREVEPYIDLGIIEVQASIVL